MVEDKKETILNLNTAQSFQVVVISLPFKTHLANMARPGTFGRTVRELLKVNNLPDVILPENAPSYEIFGAINGLTNAQILTVQVHPQETQQMKEDSDDESIEIAAKVSDIMPCPEDKSVRQKIEMYSGDKDRPTHEREITPTPANSPSRNKTKEDETLRK